MIDRGLTPTKSHSSPVTPTGVFIGVIVSVANGKMSLTVPRLAGADVFDNVEYQSAGLDTQPVAGEQVILSFLEGRQDEVVVLGRLRSGTLAPVTLTDYVATIIAGTGVTVTGSGGIGSHPTVAIGQPVATTDSPTFNTLTLTGAALTTASVGTATLFNTNATTVNIAGAATAVTIGAAGGTTTLNGNLTVNGTTTTINSTVTTIADPLVVFGSGTTTTNDGKDRGVQFNWSNGTVVKTGFFGYKNSTGKFTFIPDGTNTLEVFSGLTGELDAHVTWSNLLAVPSPVVTVTLTGAVTGTAGATMTALGSATASVATSLALGSVVLGTTTTGAYVATIAGTANQVTVTGSGGASAAVTLSTPQNIHTGATPTFAGMTLSGNLAVNTAVSADITTTTTTATLFNTGATTITIGSAATTVNIGAATGTTAVKNAMSVNGAITFTGAASITTALLTASVFNTGATTVNIAGAGTTVTIGAATGTTTINNPTTINGALTFTGAASVTTALTTASVFNSAVTTLSIGGAGTTIGIGAATGTTTVNNSLTVAGTLTLPQAAGPQISFTGATSRWITFGTVGVAAPAFTTRSVGTKLVLYEGVSAVATDYALGIEGSNMWLSVPNTGSGFKWYGGTTLLTTLSNGMWTIFPQATEGLRLAATNAYIGWYDATATTRVGYIQGINGTMMRHGTDTGVLELMAATTVRVSDGATVPRFIVDVATAAYTNNIGIQSVARQDNATGQIWSMQQLRATSAGAGAGGDQAGLALWVPSASQAPIVRNFAGTGDRVDHVNSANSGYCPAVASAFTVVSTQRVKKNITVVDDDELLSRISGVKAHTFETKVRPVSIRPSARFAELSRKWAAKGKTPLTPKDKHTELHDHDCSLDSCYGTTENPCAITLNDTPRYGLIAEHLHAAAPEVAVLDVGTHLPEGYDVDQVAAMAFGGVSALVRKFNDLTTRLEALEATRKE